LPTAVIQNDADSWRVNTSATPAGANDKQSWQLSQNGSLVVSYAYIYHAKLIFATEQ
ncbi:MAG: hypothetical protein HXY38_12220, partial [Chloroflexi bacterium]|nr:hypothetical protein [Chloroflexota bacterium]